jgi:hypothetical protein
LGTGQLHPNAASLLDFFSFVIPAKAGIQQRFLDSQRLNKRPWIPACAHRR